MKSDHSSMEKFGVELHCRRCSCMSHMHVNMFISTTYIVWLPLCHLVTVSLMAVSKSKEKAEHVEVSVDNVEFRVPYVFCERHEQEC